MGYICAPIKVDMLLIIVLIVQDGMGMWSKENFDTSAEETEVEEEKVNEETKYY